MSTVRSIGSAMVNFGMVAIPVKLFTATSDERVSFNKLHAKCGGRVKQPTTCPKCECNVDASDIVKGYEVGKDAYVTFSEFDIKALEASASPSMEIKEFVPVDAVDPVYFDGATYLGPDKGAEKAYSLLTRTLLDSGTVALAQRVFRGKEQLVAIRATPTGLVLHVLCYANEVRDHTAAAGDLAAVSEQEIQLAKQLVDQMRSDEFHPENYADSYKSRVEAAIEAKTKGEQVVGSPVVSKAQALDIMAALKASLSGGTVITETPGEHSVRQGESVALPVSESPGATKSKRTKKSKQVEASA